MAKETQFAYRLNKAYEKGNLHIKRKEVESLAKKEKSKKKNNELAAKVLDVMKALQANGVTETTSTILRNRLGTKNRAVIRRVMKLLAEEGKVVIGEKEVGKRKQYTYRLA